MFVAPFVVSQNICFATHLSVSDEVLWIAILADDQERCLVNNPATAGAGLQRLLPGLWCRLNLVSMFIARIEAMVRCIPARANPEVAIHRGDVGGARFLFHGAIVT